MYFEPVFYGLNFSSNLRWARCCHWISGSWASKKNTLVSQSAPELFINSFLPHKLRYNLFPSWCW